MKLNSRNQIALSEAESDSETEAVLSYLFRRHVGLKGLSVAPNSHSPGWQIFSFVLPDPMQNKAQLSVSGTLILEAQ